MSLRKPHIHFVIEKSDDGSYGAFSKAPWEGIHTTAATWQELKGSLLEATNLYAEFAGIASDYTWEDLQPFITIDVASFFASYRVINVREFGKRVGINNSLISQYMAGTKHPSSRQVNRIIKGIRDLGQELSQIDISV